MIKLKSWKKKIGEVGVNSGSLMVIDPHHVKHLDQDEINRRYKEKMDGYEIRNDGKTYPGDWGMAVIFQSGWGDGLYEVIAHFADYGERGGVRIEKVEIIMIDNET